MCQPAPLARCSNHAEKEAKSTENKIAKNYEERSAVNTKLRDLKIEAREMGFDEESMMDPETPNGAEIQKLHAEYERLEKENSENLKDTWEQELHLDATPNGIKNLEKEKGKPGYNAFRMKNATALNDWQKEIRNLKDSNGNKLTAKGGSLEDRHKVYLQEFISARSEHKAAQDNAYEADRQIGLINTKLAQFETRNVGFQETGDRRPGSLVAVNPEEEHQVDVLENQKTVALEMENQSHYDQVLARSKMNSLRKAILINRKAQHKEAEAKRKAEETATMEETVDLLKQKRNALYEHSKMYMGDGSEEFSRLTSKAYAVQQGTEILEKHRKANPGNEQKAVDAFRSEISYLHKEAVKNADDAAARKDEFEEANYRGEQGGLSLLLDKVRHL